MAKKKVDNQTQTQSISHQTKTKTITMDDDDDVGDEKKQQQQQLDSLKSLNAMLLKETVERRHQVDSLLHSNSLLESQMKTHNAAAASSTETAALLDIENRLLSVFINQLAQHAIRNLTHKIASLETHMQKVFQDNVHKVEDLNSRLHQLVSKIDQDNEILAGVCVQRDEITAQLDARILEVNQLGLMVKQADQFKQQMSKKVNDLKAECDRLVDKNAANETRVELLTSENASIRRDLEESNDLVDELQKSIKELNQENKAVRDDKDALEKNKSVLETFVGELEKLVESMRLKEEALLEKLADLENKYALASRNEVEMQMKISELVDEKKGSEERNEILAKEKSSVVKDLEIAMKELEQQKHTIDQIVQQKTELENAKIQTESETVKMNEELRVFKEMISSLERSSVNQNEKVKRLEVEVSRYKASHDQAMIERGEALENLNKEKTITSDLKEKIAGMERIILDLQGELSTMNTENGKRLGEKKELEDQCAELVKKVDSLEAKLAETQIEFDDTKGKLGVAMANSNRVLKILKKTLLVCDENEDTDQENGIGEGIQEHFTEVEVIKRTFKDKESRIEEMERQLELFKSSAAEAHKEKSFWTMVSSATTLLAAVVSVAYVVRARRLDLETVLPARMAEQGVDSLEAKLAETQIEFDDTKGKLGVAKANSNRVLKILKKTLLVCDENEDTDQENGVGQGIQEHFTEVEVIKRTFKDKESRIEEMERQLELLKSSAAEAHKEKSFWTMVSSATTLLVAVVSVAYVIRAR